MYSLNFFFDKNDKPYISTLNQNNDGNIRLLQYTTIWDDVPNVKINKGKTDYLYTYKYNNETYFCFSNVTNHVVRLNNDLLSGVKETRSTKSDYILFPNPTSDYLTIKNELNANSIAKIRLLNSIGIELLNDNMIEFGDKIDLNRFADGWYILEITDTENYISTYKVIKSKK